MIIRTVEGPEELTRRQWATLKLKGEVNVGPRIKEGWSGYIDFWVFRCPGNCGPNVYHCDYRHSHKQVLSCPMPFRRPDA